MNRRKGRDFFPFNAGSEATATARLDERSVSGAKRHGYSSAIDWLSRTSGVSLYQEKLASYELL